MRRKVVYQREYKPDLQYKSVAVGRFINYVMRDGKKTAAEKIVASAFDQIKQKTKQDPFALFEKALANAAPSVELMTRRIGGANYQVPIEVRPARRFILAARWIIGAARAKKGKSMGERLAEELLAAANNEGTAVKKQLDTHRMAEANRAFAHFAR